MSIDIDTLEALARAATPGPWSMAEDGSPVVDAGGRAAHLIGPPGSDEEAAANAQFIVAAQPEAILALIARLREAEEDRDDHEQARTALEEALGQVTSERDALAAHLDRFMDATSEQALADDDWMYGLDEVRNSSPTAALSLRDTGQQLQGAEAYKETLKDASNPLIWPHIEGAFEVWKIAQAEQADTAGEAS